MRVSVFFPVVVIAMLMVLCLSGCQLSTTVIVEEGHSVRLVNKYGDGVKVRWGAESYHYLDDGCTISIPVDGGYYELEWVDSPSSNTKIYRIEVEADIDIVFRDDPDVIVIRR